MITAALVWLAIVLGGVSVARYASERHQKAMRQQLRAERERADAFAALYGCAEGILALREVDRLSPMVDPISPKEGPDLPPGYNYDAWYAGQSNQAPLGLSSGLGMANAVTMSGGWVTGSALQGITSSTYGAATNVYAACAPAAPPGVRYLPATDDYLLPSGRRVGRQTVELYGWSDILAVVPDDQAAVLRYGIDPERDERWDSVMNSLAEAIQHRACAPWCGLPYRDHRVPAPPDKTRVYTRVYFAQRSPAMDAPAYCCPQRPEDK